MKNAAHYFIAISLPIQLKKEMAAIQLEMKQHFDYKVWVDEADFHITLKFLGTVETEALDSLNKALLKIEKQLSFAISIGGLGMFGKVDRPRVLFTDVEITPALNNLHEFVEVNIGALGFPTEKRMYAPHITLAKKWIGPENTVVADILAQSTNIHTVLNVCEVVLYRIHPTRTQKYEQVYTYKLSGGILNGPID